MPLSEFTFSKETTARLETEAEFDIIRLQHLTAGELGKVEGSVMVKDETICIRCGLCAERCPAKTITMEAYEVFHQDPTFFPIEKIELRT